MKFIDLRLASKCIELPDGSMVAIISREHLVSEDDKRRNIFKVDPVGTVHWQVDDYVPIPSVSTFTNIELRGREIWAYNFDGGMYRINPGNGEIISSALIK